MSSAIHFDPQVVRPVPGGVVVSFDGTQVPTRVEVVETAGVVAITVFDERRMRRRRFARHARREVFVPLVGPPTCRTVVDGSMARAPQLFAAAA